MSKSIEDFLNRTKKQYPYITLSDPTACRQKLNSLKNDGLSSLHVIADFDMTLTKHWIKTSSGKSRNLSSHAVLERGPAVSPSFAAHTKSLAEHYYPYEINPKLEMSRKIELMIEWWSAAHAAMIDEGITRAQIVAQAQYANMTWRNGINAFLDVLAEKSVPLLVFSAGIADVIESLLRISNLERRNQYVVSNHMVFGRQSSSKSNGPSSNNYASTRGKTSGSVEEREEEVLTGFAEPLIHTFNKGEQALYASPALKSVRETLLTRRNVILMGDSIGDAKMADGVDHGEKLKIGFCNFGGQERKREFLDTFDIVIEGDESLAWVTELIQWIE